MQLSYYQRNFISRFRCGNNRLPVAFGKGVDLVVDGILCHFCGDDVIGMSTIICLHVKISR